MEPLSLTKEFTQAIADVSVRGRWGAFLLLECGSTPIPEHDAPGFKKKRPGGVQTPSMPAITKILRDNVRSDDLYEHVGKGAFAILIRDGKQPDAAVRLARRLSSQLNGLSPTKRHSGSFPARIGIRIVAPESEPPQELIRQAHDEARSIAETGKQAYRLYQNEGQTGFDISATQHDGGLF